MMTYVCLHRLLVESNGEWLDLMCCDVMGDHYDDLCLPPPVACGIERPHGERLVLVCCAAPDVRPERVLLESSVNIGNG